VGFATFTVTSFRSRIEEEEGRLLRNHENFTWCKCADHCCTFLHCRWDKICIVVRMNALFRSSKQALQHAGRSFASGPHPERKVALLGAAGGIGQPLGLLLKVRMLAAVQITSSSDVKV
jgi:hypothetical protein